MTYMASPPEIDPDVSRVCGGATEPLWRAQEVMDELVLTGRDYPLGRDVFLQSLELATATLQRYENVRGENLSDVKARLLEANVEIRSTFAMDDDIRESVQAMVSRARDRLRVWICTEFGDCIINGQKTIDAGFTMPQAEAAARTGRL